MICKLDFIQYIYSDDTSFSFLFLLFFFFWKLDIAENTTKPTNSMKIFRVAETEVEVNDFS